MRGIAIVIVGCLFCLGGAQNLGGAQTRNDVIDAVKQYIAAIDRATEKAAKTPYLLPLSSPDPRVRSTALDGWLAHSPDLAEATQDLIFNDYGVEIYGFQRALVKSVDHLVDDPDANIRLKALRELAMLGASAGQRVAYWADCGNRPEASLAYDAGQALERRWPSHRREILSLLSDTDPTVVGNVLALLPKSESSRKQQTIAQLFRAADPLRRRLALSFFVPHSDRELFEVVMPLLDDPDENVRDRARYDFSSQLKDPVAAFRNRASMTTSARGALADSIHRSLGKKGWPMLRALLGDTDGQVRASALSALSVDVDETKTEVTNDELLALMADPSTAVRAVALDKLNRRHVSNLLPYVKDGLVSADSELRNVALQCVDQSQYVTLEAEIVRAVELGVAESYHISEFWTIPEHRQKLSGWLESRNAHVREEAAFGISSAKLVDEYLPNLIKLTHDAESAVVIQAIRALADSKSPSAIQALEEVAQGASAEIVIEVLHALGSINDPGTAGFIRGYLKDKDRTVRWAAASALQCIEPVRP